MGIYVSCEVSLTTKFARMYVRVMYREKSVWPKWRETGVGGHAGISHHDTSLDLLVVPREEKQQQG